MTYRLFLYGTLCDPELFEIVAGAPLVGRAATLSEHVSVWARDEIFPILVERMDQTAQGLLVEVDDTSKRRLDFYELGFGYTLRPVTVDSETGLTSALVYFPEPEIWPEGQSWSLARWQDAFGDLSREAAREYMRLLSTHSADEAAAAFAQIRTRAASRLRARAHPSFQSFDPQMNAKDVSISDTRQPYTDYFAVREDDLVFPKFNGSPSAPVRRASFMGGDAVTVLPYDPALDKVLLIRQFRHGAFARGDGNPWTLEPAAGRIDPGESPEETALRELQEETGAIANQLLRVSDYYPSPGAYSEFIFSFVAIADLSDLNGTTSGLESENEDIMSHVIPFDELMAMVETGAANTAPLVLSALWLARHRETLLTAH